jgi:polysaccharide biosynthesis protein PslG
MQVVHSTLRQGIIILCFLTALFTARSLPAQPIVADDLSGSWSTIIGTNPETNLPAAAWQSATGWTYNQSLYPVSDSNGNRWQASNGTAVAIPLASTGGYTKPDTLTISADVCIVTASGSATPWVALGFYDALQAASGGFLSSITNFTGVLLAYDGSLSLYNDGSLVATSTVAFGGTFQRDQYHTLTYTVNTTTGAISGLTLSGSTANYAALMAAGAPFSDAKTAYAGMGVAADSTSYRGVGRFKNFSLNEVPAQAFTIINDTFDLPTNNWSTENVPGTYPDTVNLPGTAWQEARGWSWAEPKIYDQASGSLANTAKLINYTGIAIGLGSTGSYVKPASLMISADVAITGGTTGTGAVFLGFYGTPPPANADSGSALGTFSGLRLTEDGALTLITNGTTGNAIAGPAVARNTLYTLAFSVNTSTGAISGVSLTGSASTYDFTTTAFTDAATAYAAFVVSGGSNTTGCVDNFIVSSTGSIETRPTAISPFGLSQNSNVTGYTTWLTAIADAGVTGFRYFPEWNSLEPSNNAFNFTGADTYTSTVDANGMQVGGVLAYSASWTSASHHEFPVNNLADWTDYVGTVVGRYNGQTQPAVSYWEVWNEPNAASFNTGSRPAADYATLVRTAYTAAKAANPDCKIGLTVANFDVRFIMQIIEALEAQGEAGSFDFIAVHPYELVGRMNAPDGELQYLNIVPVLRAMLAAKAPGKVNVPIRFTELGARIGDNLEGEICDAPLAACLLVKAYVLGIVQGAEQINWFEAKDPTGTTSSSQYGFGLMDVNQNKRPAWYAYKSMADALGATPTYKGWLALGSASQGYGLVFTGAGSNVMAAWMPKGETASVSFGATVQIVDIYTGAITSGTSVTLTDKPVFIRNLPATMVTQAAANKASPYPWGSAPLSANLAEIQLGEVSLASGIEIDKANTLVANGTGTNGVIVNQAGPTMYLSVSPSCASFGTSDVYVRVTARQTALRPTGTYAGMNLFYQPTTGSSTAAPQYPYKNIGQWFSLANTTAVQTKTWHLTDAMFVHTFGHALYFQFDASNPFVIDKVEISKTPF